VGDWIGLRSVAADVVNFARLVRGWIREPGCLWWDGVYGPASWWDATV